jgi:hypothetical protein
MSRFEAAGQHDQASQYRARVEKLQRRLYVKTLMITVAGKAVAKDFERSFLILVWKDPMQSGTAKARTPALHGVLPQFSKKHTR